jgi:hypothetical protein
MLCEDNNNRKAITIYQISSNSNNNSNNSSNNSNYSNNNFNSNNKNHNLANNRILIVLTIEQNKLLPQNSLEISNKYTKK